MPVCTPHEWLAQFEAGWSQEPVATIPLPQWIESFKSDVEAALFIAACLPDENAQTVEQRGPDLYLNAGSPGLLRQCQTLARGWIAHREELRLARTRLRSLEGNESAEG